MTYQPITPESQPEEFLNRLNQLLCDNLWNVSKPEIQKEDDQDIFKFTVTHIDMRCESTIFITQYHDDILNQPRIPSLTAWDIAQINKRLIVDIWLNDNSRENFKDILNLLHELTRLTHLINNDVDIFVIQEMDASVVDDWSKIESMIEEIKGYAHELKMVSCSDS